MLLAESLLGSSSVEPAYIEDVFSTWLYTGNGSTQTITNGINTLTPGALVWIKSRSGTTDHALYDSVRGVGPGLASNLASAEVSDFGILAFRTNGFTLGLTARVNTNAATYASWTFREQPKFFDIVTYTGNGANRTIAHNLQSVPGCIMVKRTDTTGDWQVYHRSLANTQYMVLNSNGPVATGADRWNSTTPTAAEFSLGTNAAVNANGGTYVAYLFAHDAGGFGATGADNAISCGSYTGNGSATGPVVTLGWEPQWLLIKRATGGTGDWNLIDNMRGFVVGGTDAELNPNLANAETTGTFVTPTATGFQLNTTDTGYNASGSAYIYIAIRRGPMRTPTSGTSVFDALATTQPLDASNPPPTPNILTDKSLYFVRSGFSSPLITSRLLGTPYLETASTAAANTAINAGWDVMRGWKVNAPSWNSSTPHIFYYFRRAPGFFDVVCYTGDGTNGRAVNHNLGVTPELVIVKTRNGSGLPWLVWGAPLGTTNALALNETTAPPTYGGFQDGVMTTTTFNVSGPNTNSANPSFSRYVAYLFASAPGVSKVGTYTGTGATQTINCGFSSGARFVLIKRTDSTGDWYVWDSARGIVAGNDPYILLNSTAAEVTTTDWVDTAASGFELSNAAGNNVNINGASYIFMSVS